MNKKIIKDEINKNRKSAESYFADWVVCRAQILEFKALRCLEIAEALEMALEYEHDEERMRTLEEKVKKIEKGLEMALSYLTPDEERIKILLELLTEVQK